MTTSRDIKFISYDGAYPNLCRGTLVYSVDGKEMSEKYCLSSEGTCRFGWWDLNEDKFGHLSVLEKKYLLIQVNDNVRQGCCGGCL
jgi:hypothetical protein